MDISAAKSDNSDKFLSFDLVGEAYGISILRIREIIGMIPITSVPNIPDFAKGVINLRDNVIPIIDLRLKFGMAEGIKDDRSCIVIVEISNQDFPYCNDIKKCNKPDCPAFNNIDRQCWKIPATFCRNEIQGTFHNKIEACRKCNYYIDSHEKDAILPMGLIVDSISSVINVKESDIDEAPSFGVEFNSDYIFGMAKMDNGVITLLDVDRVLTTSEASMIQSKTKPD